METLKYNTYDNNVSGTYNKNSKINNSESALANRPLMPLKNDCGCSNKQKSIPDAAEDLHKSGVIPVNTKYNDKDNNMLPITIKPGKNNEYVVLENDIMDYNNSDKMVTNIPVTKDTEKQEPKAEYKMDFSTQIYVGSLTVIGLFVFYRLIQKTR